MQDRPDIAYKEVHRCSSCYNILPDGYFKKCCELCLEKEKMRKQIKRAETEPEREAAKMAKKGLPRIFWSFSAYQEAWRSKGVEKTHPQYENDLAEAMKNLVQSRANREIDSIHHKQKANLRFVCQFLRPDLYPFSKEEGCRKFRIMKLGLYKEIKPELDDHIMIELCQSCKEWLDDLEGGSFNNEGLLFSQDMELVAFVINIVEDEDPELTKELLGNSVNNWFKDEVAHKINVFVDRSKLDESLKEKLRHYQEPNNFERGTNSEGNGW